VLAGSIAAGALVLLAVSGRAQPSSVGRVHPRVFLGVVLVAGGTIAVGGALLLAFVAFPLLRAPDQAENAFLQTASNLIAFGLSTIAIAAFAWAIEPFTLGTTTLDAAILAGEAATPTAAPATRSDEAVDAAADATPDRPIDGPDRTVESGAARPDDGTIR